MHSLLYEILVETFDDFRARANALICDIEQEALVDNLTSCLNRNAFEQRIKMLENKTHLHPIGVMFIDINDLHYINEQNGHDAGDLVLSDMGKMLKSYWGAIDTYRFGGDEFVVFRPQTTVEEFESNVSEFSRIMKLTHTFQISIGWALADNKLTLSEAISGADKNMMCAKNEYYKTHHRHR